MPHTRNPFHAGEIAAQARAGATDVADWAAGFIRSSMPDQHRAFFTQLPFLVLAGADEAGRHWVTLLDGPDRLVQAPDPGALTVQARPDAQDPLAEAIMHGTEVGLLGIELASRRRNRLSGTTRSTAAGFAIDVRQSFGNCPQYIHERLWRRVPPQGPVQATEGTELTPAQIAQITAADTLFIGTGQLSSAAHHASGFDASHRGGAPGFVDVVGPSLLRIPDYAGNNFFNTIGNLLENDRVGLVFVDFESGSLLHVSGRATVDWEPKDSHDPDARRMINVRIEAVIERPAALTLRWSRADADLRNLVVAAKIEETPEITSFYLVPADDRPLAAFKAGQHLPIELDMPDQPAPVKRSYSLSGPPGAAFYRLTVKREAHGLASRYLHDEVSVGDVIRTRSPSGDFIIPDDRSPLVLVSAGVGVTPMVAMSHDALRSGSSRPIWFVHGARNPRHHALRTEVEALRATSPRLKTHFHYSRPESGDMSSHASRAQPRLTAELLLSLGVAPDAHYLLCGPAAFIADMRNGLEAAGIDPDRIHFETFGPAH